jgi:hypothetical protein
MSALVRLSSKLPGDPEINGLDYLSEELASHPTDQVVCVLAWLTVPKVTTVTATGAVVPTVEISRVEPIGVIEKTPAAIQQLAAELYERRTGRNPLPFDQIVAPRDHIEVSQVEEF